MFQDYLGKVLAFAEKEIKAGKSKEEFIKNTSIPGVTEWPGHGIQRPLTAAYEELTQNIKKLSYLQGRKFVQYMNHYWTKCCIL